MHRRSFLRSSTAWMSLPLLPSLAHAEGNPLPQPDKKLIIVYVPNGLVRRCFFPGEEQGALPDFVGGFDADRIKKQKRIENRPGIYDLQLTSTMQPLAPHRNDITLITGLDRSYKDGQDVHAQGASCYLTSVSPAQATAQGMPHPNGRTLDQVIGDHVGQKTAFNTLEISCNGFKTGKESIEFDNISWYGPNRIAPSIRDPQKLYDRLFMKSGYQAHVTAVTDLMRADAKDLSRKLGQDDQRTMDQFLTMLRDIEVRIKKFNQLAAGTPIQKPTNADLPRGLYIQLMADLMLTALQMGITNICTFMIGPERWDASLTYEGVFDRPVDHHNLTHNQKGNGYKDLQKIDLFHMQQFAYILGRMKEIKEADGRPLLDHALITYGAGLGDGATHQYFDLPLIVGGRAQDQIKQGRFIQCKSGTLNSNLWLTVAQLMGVGLKSFADSTGTIDQLRK